MNIHKEERRAAIKVEDAMTEYDILEDRINDLRSVIRLGTPQPRRDLFWFQVMGGCGCGSSNEFAAVAWRVFRAFHDHDDWSERICKDTGLELLAHWMDSIGLTKHRGSIAFSWLTPLGDEIWDILQEVDE